ncbi:MAG: ParA family protein [Parvibaculum sp.]
MTDSESGPVTPSNSPNAPNSRDASISPDAPNSPNSPNSPNAPLAATASVPEQAKAAFAKPRVLVLANQKGGVGKTTTAINLGTALAAVGERVLIVDLDPQGNASTGLGVDRADRTLSTYDVLIGAALVENAIVPTKVPGLDLVPSTMDLLGAELELASVPRRSHRLRDAMARMPACGRELAGVTPAMNIRPYTYVLIDCPPSLNLLTINAMTAADSILVPLQCEFFALEGLSQLLRTVERVRTSLNPKLDIQGIVLTMFDQRNNLSGQVAEDVRAHLGDKVYKTVIPRNVRISEAPSYGKPALVYDHRCAGSRAYMKLASELIQRERALRRQTAA